MLKTLHMEDFVKENDYLERLVGKTFSFRKASRSHYHVETVRKRRAGPSKKNTVHITVHKSFKTTKASTSFDFLVSPQGIAFKPLWWIFSLKSVVVNYTDTFNQLPVRVICLPTTVNQHAVRHHSDCSFVFKRRLVTWFCVWHEETAVWLCVHQIGYVMKIFAHKMQKLSLTVTLLTLLTVLRIGKSYSSPFALFFIVCLVVCDAPKLNLHQTPGCLIQHFCIEECFESFWISFLWPNPKVFDTELFCFHFPVM